MNPLMISAEHLQRRLKQHQVIPINLSGNTLLLDASGALIWPAEDLIIFSDLHLEKGSFLSQFAQPLPLFDSIDTLARMQRIWGVYQSKRVLCLGDSFHDAHAVARMRQKDIACLNQMIDSSVQFIWILGNHDPDIGAAIKGQRMAWLQLSNILLVHEPEDLTSFKANMHQKDLKAPPISGQIVGHFHPKSSQRLAARKVTGKTFLLGNNMLFMPSFGTYTGGLDAKDEAFSPWLTQSLMQSYVLFADKIYQF